MENGTVSIKELTENIKAHIRTIFDSNQLLALIRHLNNLHSVATEQSIIDSGFHLHDDRQLIFHACVSDSNILEANRAKFMLMNKGRPLDECYVNFINLFQHYVGGFNMATVIRTFTPSFKLHRYGVSNNRLDLTYCHASPEPSIVLSGNLDLDEISSHDLVIFELDLERAL